jgi:hypothetical protein
MQDRVACPSIPPTGAPVTRNRFGESTFSLGSLLPLGRDIAVSQTRQVRPVEDCLAEHSIPNVCRPSPWLPDALWLHRVRYIGMRTESREQV